MKITDKNIFIAYASSGRFNGSAVVIAENKKHARQIIKNSNWLDQDKIDNIYNITETSDDADELGIEDMEMGEWEELDWGT